MKDNEFKCAMCGGIFEKAWLDEEAKAEYKEVWGDLCPPDCKTELVCDDCYKSIFTIEF